MAWTGVVELDITSQWQHLNLMVWGSIGMYSPLRTKNSSSHRVRVLTVLLLAHLVSRGLELMILLEVPHSVKYRPLKLAGPKRLDGGAAVSTGLTLVASPALLRDESLV